MLSGKGKSSTSPTRNSARPARTASVAGHPSVNLPDMEYAEELAAILNANDLKQRLSHGRFPGGFA